MQKEEKKKMIFQVFRFVLVALLLISLCFPFIAEDFNCNYNYFKYKINCKLKGGVTGEVYVYSSPKRICIIKANDYGKECNDNNDCEGECKIRDEDFLEDKWELLYGKTYEYDKIRGTSVVGTVEVDLLEFENKAGVKVRGNCSEFKKNLYCGGNDKKFNVKNGKINVLWSGNYEDCRQILDDTTNYK
ncbi:MAG: hypothetical protein KAU07_03615 [Candidatus Andersenbacteria bacterium]|nr:hypothetical protein [Candidatus Andersenbacteria bacterium]